MRLSFRDVFFLPPSGDVGGREGRYYFWMEFIQKSFFLQNILVWRMRNDTWRNAFFAHHPTLSRQQMICCQKRKCRKMTSVLLMPMILKCVGIMKLLFSSCEGARFKGRTKGRVGKDEFHTRSVVHQLLASGLVFQCQVRLSYMTEAKMNRES